ncbi:MAG TPA: hypothetical protein VHX42_00195, partial [Candidatus Babeliales bacterium]|nr:hypothetical protein [Candidatus Babeliales bacterium]
MKQYRKHIICILAACAFLLIVRGTRTLSYDEVVRTLRQYYDQTKAFVGRKIVSPVVVKMITSQEKAITNNPYKDTIATVRIGNELHPEERAYRAHREPKVKAALEKLLGRSLNGKKIPTIAFVGSGGGYRAMLCTTGFMVGAEKIGLVDAATYIAALSGSTWALGTWMMTGWSWADFRIYLEGVVIKNIFKIDSSVARHIADVFATKLAF